MIASIVAMVVTGATAIAAIGPQLDATKNDVIRLRGEMIEHRSRDAHPRSAQDQAVVESRLQSLERIPTKLDSIDTRLREIERKQDAICLSYPACRRRMRH